MTDYERGIEQASVVYKEVIREYVAENAKLRELAKNLKACNSSCGRCIELFGKCDYEAELRELGTEVK